MPTIPKGTKFGAMAIEAEAAVAGVKDPELRRMAFERILNSLMGQGSHDGGPPRPRGKGSARARTPGGSAPREARARRGPKARVEELIGDGFFGTQRTIADVKTELANRGHHIALTSLSGPLQSLTRERRLRRQKATANGKGTKSTFVYSNW